MSANLTIEEIAQFYNVTVSEISRCIRYITWTVRDKSLTNDDVLKALSEVLAKSPRREVSVQKYRENVYGIRFRAASKPQLVNVIKERFGGVLNETTGEWVLTLSTKDLSPLKRWLDTGELENLPSDGQTDHPKVPSKDCRAVFIKEMESNKISYGSQDEVSGKKILDVARSSSFHPTCIDRLEEFSRKIDSNKTYPPVLAYYIFDTSKDFERGPRTYTFDDGSVVYIYTTNPQATDPAKSDKPKDVNLSKVISSKSIDSFRLLYFRSVGDLIPPTSISTKPPEVVVGGGYIIQPNAARNAEIRSKLTSLRVYIVKEGHGDGRARPLGYVDMSIPLKLKAGKSSFSTLDRLYREVKTLEKMNIGAIIYKTVIMDGTIKTYKRFPTVNDQNEVDANGHIKLRFNDTDEESSEPSKQKNYARVITFDVNCGENDTDILEKVVKIIEKVMGR